MKDKLIECILQEIERELATIMAAALDAKEAATHEDSKAENKYDTRGLEASYLAGAQAKRAAEVQRTHAGLKKLEVRSFDQNSVIDTTALVEVQIEDEDEHRWFFILPQAGGMNFVVEGVPVYVISRSSPLAQKLVGKKVGDSFDHEKKGESLEYTIVSVR